MTRYMLSLFLALVPGVAMSDIRMSVEVENPQPTEVSSTQSNSASGRKEAAQRRITPTQKGISSHDSVNEHTNAGNSEETPTSEGTNDSHRAETSSVEEPTDVVMEGVTREENSSETTSRQLTDGLALSDVGENSFSQSTPDFPVRLNLNLAPRYSFEEIWAAINHNENRPTFARSHGPWIVRGYVFQDGLGGRCIAETNARNDDRRFGVVIEMNPGILNWMRSISFVLTNNNEGNSVLLPTSISFDRSRAFNLMGEQGNGLLSVTIPHNMEGQFRQLFRNANTMHILSAGSRVVSISLNRSSEIPSILDECMNDTRAKAQHIQEIIESIQSNRG